MRLYDDVASGNCYTARLPLTLLEKPYERVAIDSFARRAWSRAPTVGSAQSRS